MARKSLFKAEAAENTENLDIHSLSVFAALRALFTLLYGSGSAGLEFVKSILRSRNALFPTSNQNHFVPEKQGKIHTPFLDTLTFDPSFSVIPAFSVLFAVSYYQSNLTFEKYENPFRFLRCC
jgi:hypothetical protein